MDVFRPEDQLCYVIGYYRSGTSLLHALMTRHPSIRLLYECDLLKLWPVVREEGLQTDWEERLEFWNKTFSRHGISESSSAPAPKNRKEAAVEIYRRFKLQSNACVYGAKSAYYHDSLLELKALFPDSKIVIIWRSPLDILRSIRRAGKTDRFFNRKEYMRRMVCEIKTMVRDSHRLLEEGHAICQLSYRELVNAPQVPLKRICDYLNLEFHPGMLDLSKANVSMLPSGEHHAGVRSGRVRAPGKREEILTAEEIAFVTKNIENIPDAPWASRTTEQGEDLQWVDGHKPLDPSWSLNLREVLENTYYQLRDLLVHVVYGLAPMPWLIKFRSRRRGSTTILPWLLSAVTYPF